MAGSFREPEALASVEDVLAEMLAALEPLPPAEAALDEVAGLVLAEPLVAPWSLPRFDNAAMDGFAIRSADVARAGSSDPSRLRVAGASFAGSPGTPGKVPVVEAGTAVVIATGAPVPPGADAVVRVEDTRREGDEVTLARPVEPGENVRRTGEDIRTGEVVVPAGAVLGPGQVAAAAAFGVAALRVHPRPRVVVLPTGDELCAPNGAFDATGPALLALLRDAGCAPSLEPPARDDLEVLVEAMHRAADGADAVVTVGGISMGERDFVKPAAARLGWLTAWRVALRPAKPFAFGLISGTPLFALPGNPASTLAAFEVFVRPALGALLGRRGSQRPSFRAALAEGFRQRPGRLHLVRGRCWRQGGRLLAGPAGSQGAGMIGSLARANAWIVVPADVEQLPAGAEVEVRPMFAGPPPGWESQEESS